MFVAGLFGFVSYLVLCRKKLRENRLIERYRDEPEDVSDSQKYTMNVISNYS